MPSEYLTPQQRWSVAVGKSKTYFDALHSTNKPLFTLYSQLGDGNLEDGYNKFNTLYLLRRDKILHTYNRVKKLPQLSLRIFAYPASAELYGGDTNMFIKQLSFNLKSETLRSYRLEQFSIFKEVYKFIQPILPLINYYEKEQKNYEQATEKQTETVTTNGVIH